MSADVNHEWWRDSRCHFGDLNADDPVLRERKDVEFAVDFIRANLGIPNNARILDLCCGHGRYAVELARAGFDVVGMDLNEEYVSLAQLVCERESVAATFIAWDMRKIPFADHFDAVINVGTSFGFFADDSENEMVTAQVASALETGGVFLLEMGNRDYYLKHAIAKDWYERPDGVIVTVQRQFDYLRSRMNTTFQALHDGQPREQWSHSWRAYTLAETARMLQQASLETVDTYGDWKCAPHSVNSSRMVVVSRKS